MNRSYNNTPEEIEEEAKKIDSYRSTMLNLTNHTKEDLNRVKRDIKYLYGYEKDYFSYKEIDDNIQFLTSTVFRAEKQKYIDKIKQYDDVVKSIEQTGENSYKIETVDGTISFSTINELATDRTALLAANNDDEGIKNYFRNISHFQTRAHECHYLSIYATHILEDFLDIKNKMVTGYTCYATEKSKYLHTWNEFKIGEKEYVLDSTLNVIMNKEGYYLLRHIDKEEIFDKIDSYTVISDYEKYGDIIKKDIKRYVTSRDLFIQEIERKINQGEDR